MYVLCYYNAASNELSATSLNVNVVEQSAVTAATERCSLSSRTVAGRWLLHPEHVSLPGV
jgi:hypothetical protein